MTLRTMSPSWYLLGIGAHVVLDLRLTAGVTWACWRWNGHPMRPCERAAQA